MASPAKFIREVRQEMARVVWPSRRETIISTVMVLAMVVIASIFFLIVDSISQKLVHLFLGL